MERVLNLAGKNSSEIFQLRYPFSLLSFCDYDLSYFAENAIAVCDEALRSGELDTDRVTDLRNSLKNMHVFIEHNLRTIYDKIVLDCWIDYVCRRDGVGTSALWNRFIDCKTAFEKAVFVRLCEYRYNKGINEWLNLVRVQDYAKNKVYFLFSRDLSSAEEAGARRNYFDLMFSVTARELGCRLEDIGVTQVYSAGRLPSAPFMFPTISKDIVKNVLADFDYSDDYSDIGSYEALSDQIAMDAFSHMKSGLEQEIGSYNMSRSAMENAPSKVYVPCGLKAAVDLEIDALLESGGWLARCKRCGRYYVKDADYTEDYCSLPKPGGKTCLELYNLEHPRVRVTPEIERQCAQITDEMYGRVTSGELSLKEYEGWKLYLEAMKEKVNNGEIQTSDLISFISYSKSLDISRSNPVVEVRRQEPERPQERVVKPFVPERISRSELSGKPDKPKEAAQEEPPFQPNKPRREGFFTSPSVERQKSQGKAPMSHIIRGEISAQPKPYQVSLEQPSAAPEQAFAAFGGEDFTRAEQPRRTAEAAPERAFTAFSGEDFTRAEQPRRAAEAAPERAFTAFSGEDFTRAEQPRRAVEAAPERGFTAFSGDDFTRTEQPRRAAEAAPERAFAAFSGEDFTRAEQPRRTAEAAPEQAFTAFGGEDFTRAEQPRSTVEPAPEQPSAPKPKVIRKNAAAISAYGKISGAPLVRAEEGFEAVSRPEPAPPAQPTQPTQPAAEQLMPPEDDPFWEIDSIFDVLEQAETQMSSDPGRKPAEKRTKSHNQPEKPQPSVTEQEQPPIIDEQEEASAILRADKRRSERNEDNGRNGRGNPAAQEVPSGIWTEERNLYETESDDFSPHEELNMLKEKKRRSSKTQRLFDAIMKEPDDNPNFRKK